jgi:hypothetical protein
LEAGDDDEVAAGGKEVLMRNALILLVLALLAVGCGAKESGLAESDEALKDAGSSRMEMTVADSELPPGFTATGSIDYARDRAELVIKSKAMDLPGGEMHVRFIGRTAYIGWTLLGKLRWQKETEYDPTAAERFMPGLGGPNPDQLLGTIIKASEKIETLGNDEIRGVSTKHYRAHIDKEKFNDDARDLPDKLVIDAWIDEDGLVRRVRLPDSDTSTTMIDLYDFGVEVDVEAPSADEIITEDELMKLAEKECAQVRQRGEAPEDSFACAMGGVLVSDYEGSIETVPQTETER